MRFQHLASILVLGDRALVRAEEESEFTLDNVWGSNDDNEADNVVENQDQVAQDWSSKLFGLPAESSQYGAVGIYNGYWMFSFLIRMLRGNYQDNFFYTFEILFYYCNS